MSKHCHDEHCSCHEQEHHHDHDHCSCNEHDHHHDHDHCSCNEHDHHHDHDHCGCAHCEEKLHGEVKFDTAVLIRLCISAALLILALVLPFKGPYATWPRLVAFLLPYLIIGYDVLLGAFRNVLHGKVFDEQFLMSIATVGAFLIGEYAEGIAVMLFYQLGELLQGIAVGKSRRSIAALMDIRPPFAVVLREGRELTVSPEEVEVGECIVVRAGEKIPLDGEVLQGESSIDNAALTGESVPLFCKVGDRVNSGGVNMGGVITVRVQSRYHESTVARILELVEHAAEKKSRVEGFITRFSRYYTPAVVGCALLLALLPPLAFSQPLGEWVRRALVFLVVSCPCALVISVPLSFFGGIGAASRQGVLVKGAGYLEQLARVDTVAFDKTGTLTAGRFSVGLIESPALPEARLLAIAASLEQYSNHPLALGICAAFKGDLSPVSDLHESAGKGVRGVLDGTCYLAGNAAWMQENGISVPQVDAVGSVVFVAERAGYLGYVLLQDTVKPNAKTALEALRACGVKHTVMLTGDRDPVADEVVAILGISELHAELLPDEKVACVEQQLVQGRRVAFVGDGINDAPVLARADVGVAMGGIGSDAAIESADVVLMNDDLSKLSRAITIARRTMRIVHQNIAFALAAKGIILLLGALGYANLWIAVFGDVGVMLLAILNSMRALLPAQK